MSLLLAFADYRLHYLVQVRTALSTLVYPIQNIASMPSDFSDWVTDKLESSDEIQKRLTALEAENLLNNVRLQKLQALERENIRLRGLLGSSFRVHERVSVAELLTIDLDPFSQRVMINKGTQDGVFVGQPVLDATGVMGQILEVGLFSSTVILLTDLSHAIPVQINRNGLRSVAIGGGLENALQLQYIPHSEDIREGDLLVTSGLGGRFPVGYPVGKIDKVTFPSGEAFAEISASPVANLMKSREVLLVFPSNKPHDEQVHDEADEADEADEDVMQ